MNMQTADQPTVRAAVLGASGYSGGELLRLLAGHPRVQIVAAGASERAGLTVGDVHPHLAPLGALPLEDLGPDVADRCDVAFLALPHGTSAQLAPALLERGARVIDLAGDFRLPAEEYPGWYGFEHPAPEWLGKAVYGLPELFRADIPGAQLVANPGCFPTAAALALAPAARAGMLGAPVIVDAKTGVSGAGAKPTSTVHYAQTEGSVRPYRVASHQHTPEIERALAAVGGGDVRVTFVPHLVPAVRGVLVTCYAPFAGRTTAGDVDRVIHEAYDDEPFVRVLGDGTMPDPKRVAGTNVCEIGIGVDARTGTAIVAAAIDNLGKGAAGQAVQNMNLLFGFDEATALPVLGVYP
jgi:N-acetyl-gamma-glutamyl-phosphate reductase